ncbi:hypothetical protein ACWFR1_34235 [Streptomyces sp. NPDC055103]
MSAREDAVQAFVNGGWSEQIAREIVASVRAEALAERDAQVIEWLGKKAGEFGKSNRENRSKAEAVARMADKLSRGAVRDDETGVSELYRLRSENGRLRSEARQLRNDITGACLARWEEEQENARLRLAWRSARERAQAYGEGILRHVEERDSYAGWLKQEQAVTQQLRARVAELEAERHSTNEALSDAAVQLWVQRDRIAELEKRQAEDPYDALPTFSASEIARWQARQQEDPHDGPNHHDYALGRDLPAIPHQRDEEAL